MLSRLNRSQIYVIIVFLFLLTAFHFIFRDFFPLPNGRMGHDYILTLSSLLDGYLWFTNNGILIPPWFTPSFCGGQPYFADPQSIFYSLPQFLTFVVDPIQAAYIAFLIFAGFAFWGMYLFVKHILRVDSIAAIGAATVFMFNGFYSTRMIVGHYGYQSFALAPMLAWLLLEGIEGSRNNLRTATQTLLAGILITYCFHSGITTLLIPFGFSVFALACLAQMYRRKIIIINFLFRAIAALVISIGLCASKLNANFSLMGNFQRDYYPLPGISNPVVLGQFILESLFYSGEHVYKSITPFWQNMRWAAMPHELSYNLTPITLIILLVALGRWAIRSDSRRRIMEATHPQYMAALILCIISLIPVALLYYSPGWNIFLKSLPLVGSTTSPFRWLIIYLPVVAAIVATSITSLEKFKVATLIFILIGVPALNMAEQRTFLESQDFDPGPITNYYRQVRDGETTPMIQRIGIADNNNSQLAKGISSAYCYNPLFGYQLEKYRLNPLVIGAISDTTPDGTLNLRNPACLVFPAENNCKLWDAFTLEQVPNMNNFAGYRPMEFERSIRQKLADKITELSLVICFLSLLFLAILSFKWRPNNRT